jgi:hypothetical protein
MEDIKPIKNIPDWNPIRVRTKGRQKNKWRDEVVNDLKKIN